MLSIYNPVGDTNTVIFLALDAFVTSLLAFDGKRLTLKGPVDHFGDVGDTQQCQLVRNGDRYVFGFDYLSHRSALIAGLEVDADEKIDRPQLTGVFKSGRCTDQKPPSQGVFFPRFRNKARVHRDGSEPPRTHFVRKVKVEREPVKVVPGESVPVGLFGEQSVPSHLEEINLAEYRHE